ncbi:hypothetical protein Fmac_022798 [Flemingia macrophylla]|uniref:Pectinesterase inhibitor domain-containing protein n=1 Tax=Flemingia macrophylla TaxID=520843 RepID=A0ABD1M0X4_9FABA
MHLHVASHLVRFTFNFLMNRLDFSDAYSFIPFSDLLTISHNLLIKPPFFTSTNANAKEIEREIKMAMQALVSILLSLVFISTFLQIASSASNSDPTTNSTKAYKKFIKDQCNSTPYPKLCYKFLSSYASTIKRNRVTLTKISIHVALKAAKAASRTLTNVSKSKGLTHGETSVIADCRENVGDSVDLLGQSADELAHLNGTSIDQKFQWDSIKTWMSAAITDLSTCTDEFDEIQVRPSLQSKIKTSVYNVSWLNSNALAFVNRLYY